ncbi:MAG TPA: DNA/RNA helicase domain-containing protein [Cyclobacteriaceae bacterium]|nr:DNA/RNA helicase domain-containing protein [Cyclobacteriaceae bacterium]
MQIKDDELKDLEVLVNHLKSQSPKMTLFDKYFIGYTIPQISKEFDLLRIDDESVVNIELKRSSTHEKIKTQLIRNKYYLSFLKRKTYNYSYVSEDKKLYTIDEDQCLIETTITQLLETLASQIVKKIVDIDSYFNPSNYLVSPFNSTQEFIDGKYFLTAHQEMIKEKTLEQLSTPTYSILSIKGRAGTGKTLLTFDIAKEILQKKKTLIVHCGYLNAGHLTLRDKCGWNIIPAKTLTSEDLSKYFLIIIDEAQRIYQTQLTHVIREVKKNSNNCIFSYDGFQTLRRGEIHENIAEKIEKEVTTKPFELTTKIRTNKEVASFIQCLFDKNRPIEKYKYSNIEIRFFENYQEARTYLYQLRTEDWKIINYTPSRISTHPYEHHNVEVEPDNAHTVIGQEFNNVAAVIDAHFYYRGVTLSTKNYQKRPYYHPTKMLFQIVSRTRLKLCIVIINNPEILSRCLNILQQSTVISP